MKRMIFKTEKDGKTRFFVDEYPGWKAFFKEKDIEGIVNLDEEVGYHACKNSVLYDDMRDYVDELQHEKDLPDDKKYIVTYFKISDDGSGLVQLVDFDITKQQIIENVIAQKYVEGADYFTMEQLQRPCQLCGHYDETSICHSCREKLERCSVCQYLSKPQNDDCNYAEWKCNLTNTSCVSNTMCKMQKKVSEEQEMKEVKEVKEEVENIPVSWAIGIRDNYSNNEEIIRCNTRQGAWDKICKHINNQNTTETYFDYDNGIASYTNAYENTTYYYRIIKVDTANRIVEGLCRLYPVNDNENISWAIGISDESDNPETIIRYESRDKAWQGIAKQIEDRYTVDPFWVCKDTCNYKQGTATFTDVYDDITYYRIIQVDADNNIIKPLCPLSDDSDKDKVDNKEENFVPWTKNEEKEYEIHIVDFGTNQKNILTTCSAQHEAWIKILDFVYELMYEDSMLFVQKEWNVNYNPKKGVAILSQNNKAAFLYKIVEVNVPIKDTINMDIQMPFSENDMEKMREKFNIRKDNKDDLMSAVWKCVEKYLE